MKTKAAVARKPSRTSAPTSKPSGKPAPGAGRSVARRGDTTRLSILNSAERCFGESGFDGVSLRTITEMAGVDLALVNYHFRSKENLLHEVIARRACVVHDERVRALELARQKAGTRSPSIEAIVTAFLEPLLRRLAGGDPGWRHYGSLISQLDVLPKFVTLAGDVLDPTALHFINALRACSCPTLRSDRSIGAICFLSDRWCRSFRRPAASSDCRAASAARTTSTLHYASSSHSSAGDYARSVRNPNTEANC